MLPQEREEALEPGGVWDPPDTWMKAHVPAAVDFPRPSPSSANTWVHRMPESK